LNVLEDEKIHIKALIQGSKDAYTILYKQYWRQTYNFSRLYLKDAKDAEEVVQEVFIRIWESRAMLQENESLKGLLFIITRNLIFNQHRKRLNETACKMAILAGMEQSYDIEKEIEANNLSEHIDRMIEGLPPRRKEIFNLSRKENKSYKEIALLLNISEKTVENQIAESLKYLKKNLYFL
jgi:RNA polymerase sigma-70 factor (ECF subfamily)